MTDIQHLANFYSGPASILRDHTVLTAVSTFLQSTKQEIIEALILRQTPVSRPDGGKVTWAGYVHHPKKEQRKTRYITEPLPQLREIQDKILFFIQALEDRNEEMRQELHLYARWQWHKIDSLIQDRATMWIKFDESPIRKVNIHRRAHEAPPYFIKLDIAHAYSSLSEERLAAELQEILKSQFTIAPFKTLSPQELQRTLALLAHFLCYDNHLATGSPASPFIFHKALEKTDKEVTQFLSTLPIENAVYTRYMDDAGISFSHILTPTSTEIGQFFNSLVELYESIGEKDGLEVATELRTLLRDLDRFFMWTEIYISDSYSKKYIRWQVLQLRWILLAFKEVLFHWSDHARDKAIAYIDSGAAEYTEKMDKFTALRLFHITQKTINGIESYSKTMVARIHCTIGRLDRYKRMLDKTEPNYLITKEKIEKELIRIFTKEWRPINVSKSVSRLPNSPAMNKMLGLGINNKGDITIPRKQIKEKLRMYIDILTGKLPIPYHLKHKETDTLDYRKVIASLQGYKEYILTIKWFNKKLKRVPRMRIMRHMLTIFSKEERIMITEIETICAKHFGNTVKEMYDLLFAGRNLEKAMALDEGEEGPPDERDIPWELAESNRPLGEDEEGNIIPIDIRDIPWEDSENSQG